MTRYSRPAARRTRVMEKLGHDDGCGCPPDTICSEIGDCRDCWREYLMGGKE